MATLNETIEQVQNVFKDIESALQEQGVDTENLKPIDYAEAVRGIVNDITVENVSFLPAMIFRYSSTIPNKPSGGNWIRNEYVNQIVPPEGWFLDLNDTEDASVETDGIYMSVCIFKQDGTKFMDWTTPVRISGKDGKDGEVGKQGPAGNIAGVVVEYNTPLFTITNTSNVPIAPNCTYDVQNKNLNINSDGWSLDTPTEDEPGAANIIWQSIARYYSDKQSVHCSTPVRISAGSPDIFQTDGFYTEYCVTQNVNDEKSEWFVPPYSDPPVPTITSPFLWARDVMKTTVTGTHTGPVYLFATYTAGLIGIDVDYTCAPSRESLENLDESLWFDDSATALTPNAVIEYYGLTEDSKYLWAREQFLYSNKEPDVHYRIVSTFTASEKAAIIYSAGTFNEKVKYTRTEEQTLYVFYADGVKLTDDNKYSEDGKEYYYFVLKHSYDDDLYRVYSSGNTYPSIKDLYITAFNSNKKCNWEKMESFDAIYSDIGVFKAANVGKFVFDDRYIFSQLGKDINGVTRDYTYFADFPNGWNNVPTLSDPKVQRTGIAMAIEVGYFIPEVCIDAVDGDAWFGHKTSYFGSNGNGWISDGRVAWNNEGKFIISNSEENPTQYVLVEDGNVKISGQLEIGNNSTGLTNLTDWVTAENNLKQDTTSKINAATSEWNTALKKAQEELNSTITSSENTLRTVITDLENNQQITIEELNKRLDGAVTNHYKPGDPPTYIEDINSLFEEDTVWKNHIGDTYTNINTYPSDNNGGKSWRWCQWDNNYSLLDSEKIEDPENNGVYYHWHIITDNDASRALLAAANAQTAADGKSRTFVSQPKPPYSVGDLWVQGESGDIMRCKVARETGSYTVSDWEIASKYTDDTRANEAITAAQNAQAVATAASDRLSLWASDNVISRVELSAVREEYESVNSDFADISKQASLYGLSDTEFAECYDAYNLYLVAIIDAFNNPNKDTVDVPADMAYVQKLYYESRTNILGDISNAAKTYVDDSVKEVSAKIPDVSYLTNTMKDGDTVVNGGLVMTSLVAVADTVESAESGVEAFLNGSTLAEDSDYGKLILAAGIPEETADGSTDLEERAKEAATRIYESGHIESNDIHLRKGATIGSSIIVNDDGIVVDNPNQNGAIWISEGEGFLSEGHSKNGDWEDNWAIRIGGAGCSNILADFRANDLGYCPGNGVIPIMVGNHPSKIAISITGGMVEGLRPKVRTLTSSSVLTDYDHTIMIDSETAITITLPSAPQIGQEYEFMCNGLHTTSLKHVIEVPSGGTMKMHWPLVNSWSQTSFNIDAYGVVKIICAEDAWGVPVWWIYRLC